MPYSTRLSRDKAFRFKQSHCDRVFAERLLWFHQTFCIVLVKISGAMRSYNWINFNIQYFDSGITTALGDYIIIDFMVEEFTDIL